jgi:hypothetical protein
VDENLAMSVHIYSSTLSHIFASIRAILAPVASPTSSLHRAIAMVAFAAGVGAAHRTGVPELRVRLTGTYWKNRWGILRRDRCVKDRWLVTPTPIALKAARHTCWRLRVGSVCCKEGRFSTGAVVLSCWARFGLVR